MKQAWDDRYASGETPWEKGETDPCLVALVEAGRLPKGRALDIGCGMGTQSRFLAARGYQVVGVDLSTVAIDRAREINEEQGFSIELHQLDIVEDELPEGNFELVFDRGCFHVFDDPKARAHFASRVASHLQPDGLWVSLIGSTEGPPRDHGPPRRSARDIATAVEPVLEIVELRAIEFAADLPSRALAWLLLASPRAVPAQPSSGRE